MNLSLMFLCVSGACISVCGLALPLRVTEHAGVARTSAPVSNSVPMPKGAYQPADTVLFAIQDSATNKSVPAGFTVVETWEDGSIRWLGVAFDATVAASGATTYILSDKGSNPASGTLTVSETAGVVTVTTGVARFTMHSTGFNIFDEAWADLSGSGNYDSAHKIIESGNASALTVGTNVTTGATAQLSVVWHTPGQVCIRAAVSAGAQYPMVLYVTAYRNKPYVRIIHNWYMNDFASSSMVLSALSMNFKTRLAGALTATVSHLDADGRFETALSTGEQLTEHYSSSDVYEIKKNATLLASGKGQNEVTGGTKKMGWLHVSDGTKGLGCGMRYFWEMAPKHLLANSTGALSLGLYSSLGPATDWYGGFGRTHIAFVNFSDSIGLTEEAYYAIAQPLYAIPPAVWLCGKTQVFGNTLVHADPDMFAHNSTERTSWVRFFNVYKNTCLVFGHAGYAAALQYPYATGAMTWNNGYNFLWYGDNVDPVNCCCANRQHTANNYYDMAYLGALAYAMHADQTTALWGMGRALQTADLDHDNVNGDCKICPGVEQFFGYQDCIAGNDGNANHWKITGLLDWWAVYNEPMLKELALRIVRFPMNRFANNGEYRSLGHVLMGLASAYEATGDAQYRDRAHLYYTNGPNTGDHCATVLTSNYFQNAIVGAGIADHVFADSGDAHAQTMLLTWARNVAADNQTVADAFPQWFLGGLSKALELAPEDTLIAHGAQRCWEAFFVSANLSPSARAKEHVERFREAPDYLKYLLINPDYLTQYPDYLAQSFPPDQIEKNSGRTAARAFVSVSPNPFTRTVAISFAFNKHIRETEPPFVQVYDINGRLVQTLQPGMGRTTVIWRPGEIRSGVYVIKATAGSQVAAGRVIVMR
ncbi:MAG: hypothetical protein A2487_16855 [Candidatus Raymondbacteria bacterium RifOxyC12_full_50_8]|nr:MAG: hypothetical protein A2487_16855 [Candidatus Raymondbacteria bacterium RifOxyC12_full_50_8]